MRSRKPRVLDLAPAEVPSLRRLARRQTRPWYQVQRARVVLAVAGGERIQSVAERMECDPSTVWRICRRYQDNGLDGLLEVAARAGRPLEISPPATGANRATGVFGADR
jgi:hypothetical protein